MSKEESLALSPRCQQRTGYTDGARRRLSAELIVRWRTLLPSSDKLGNFSWSSRFNSYAMAPYAPNDSITTNCYSNYVNDPFNVPFLVWFWYIYILPYVNAYPKLCSYPWILTQRMYLQHLCFLICCRRHSWTNLWLCFWTYFFCSCWGRVYTFSPKKYISRIRYYLCLWVSFLCRFQTYHFLDLSKVLNLRRTCYFMSFCRSSCLSQHTKWGIKKSQKIMLLYGDWLLLGS